MGIVRSGAEGPTPAAPAFAGFLGGWGILRGFILKGMLVFALTDPCSITAPGPATDVAPAAAGGYNPLHNQHLHYSVKKA